MGKRIALRKCVGCQEMFDKRDLWRIVRLDEQHYVLDKTGKQNGRGAYLCKEKQCLDKAIKNKGLNRSFGGGIPESVYDQLREAFGTIEK